MKKKLTAGREPQRFSPWLKRLLIMKMLVILLLVVGLTSSYAESDAQTTKLNLKLKSATVKDVIQEIERQTDLSFMYDNNVFNVDRPVSISVENATVKSVVEKLISGENLKYEMVNRYIVITANNTPSAFSQQQKSVSGKVTDSSGASLPGVSVVVKGTTNGTISDGNGNYSLSNIPENAIVQFSFVGMKRQEIEVAGKTTINITLTEDAFGIEEVVAVGYGVQKKVNLTGSVASVSGEELAKRPVVNITQSLQGLVPGLNVNISNKGGTPGSSYNLNIRGQGNLSGSDTPYVLVDGMEMSLSDVNPNDIENISVLKDAAAASIYGARAAYGVILVTTKKGKTSKPSISYNTNMGLTHAAKLPNMVNSFEFAKFFNTGWKNGTGNVEYSETKLALLEQFVKNPTGMNQWPEQSSNWFSAENSPNGVGNTNSFKLQYKNFAIRQDHNLSVTGGNEKIQYYISGGYYDEDGLLKYADIGYKRTSLNAKLNAEIASWIKFKLNTKFTDSKNNTPFGSYAVNENMFFHNMARMRPTNSPYDLNGHFTELSQIPYLQSGSKNDTSDGNLGILTGFELEPAEKWKIYIDNNFRFDTENNEQIGLPALINGLDGTTRYEARSELGIPINGSYYRSFSKTTYNTTNVYSNYTLSINDKHNFVFLAGGQQEQNKYSSLWSKASDLLSFNNPGLNISSGEKVTGETRQDWATLGVFGRVNYDFKGIYLLEANARYDGSSRFAKDNRWGFFPSVSVGYNISREEFMAKTNTWLNSLKIRGSYGLLGNQSGAGLYTFAQTMSTSSQGTWFFQNGREMYINVPASFNSYTTWEKIENSNAAIDFSLFNGQLSGSIDVYQRTTRDMLGPTAKLADMYGTSAPQTNNATMRNRGWELSLNFRDKINPNLSYSVGAMISDYTAKVIEYQNPTLSDPANSWYAGKTVGEIWGYSASGLIQTQEEADEYNALDLKYLTGQKWKPGDVKYLDLNGDSKVNKGANIVGDMGDYTIIGNSTPRYQYSINYSLTWKRLSLSMLWQGVGKRDYNPASSVYFWGAGAKAQVTVFEEHLDYWTPENPGAYYPNPYIGTVGALPAYSAKTTQTADRYMQDASYIRLKNLTLNYELPEKWLKAIKFQRINMYCSGENLLTLTKLAKMFDPETVFVFNEGGKNYALTQVFSLGINITY